MAKIYAGEILEMTEGEYEDVETKDKQSILNVIIGVSKTLVGDIKVVTKQTAVLFREIADKAKADFAVGDFILLNGVSRNPRVYVTKIKGTRVETVDINLDKTGTVNQLARADYEANIDALSKLMLTEKELEFASADRVALAKAEETSGAGADEGEVDEVFK